MKYPFFLVAKQHGGWEIKATTVHAEDFAEALELAGAELRRMMDQARAEGRPLAVKSIEIMLKSGSMQAVRPAG